MDLARLKIAKPKIVPRSFDELKTQAYNTSECGKKLNKLLNLDNDVIKSELNEKLNSFKQEYLQQNFYYSFRYHERKVLDDIEKRYPLMTWLNHFKIDIPELWNESENTSIQLMLGINNATPINQPINETRIDDLIRELGIANNIFIDPDEYEYLEEEDKKYIQTKFLEFERNVLISVYMTIMGCHPTEIRGGKNKRRRTKRRNQKTKERKTEKRKKGRKRK